MALELTFNRIRSPINDPRHMLCLHSCHTLTHDTPPYLDPHHASSHALTYPIPRPTSCLHSCHANTKFLQSNWISLAVLTRDFFLTCWGWRSQMVTLISSRISSMNSIDSPSCMATNCRLQLCAILKNVSHAMSCTPSWVSEFKKFKLYKKKLKNININGLDLDLTAVSIHHNWTTVTSTSHYKHEMLDIGASTRGPAKTAINTNEPANIAILRILWKTRQVSRWLSNV